MDVNVFTSPIITDASGKKFGKSEGNAVWLDATMLSPYKFYQFWINRPDVEMESLLKAFTFLPKAEIERLVEESKTNPGKREAQKTLAWEVTSFVHGEAATQAAIDASGALFGRGGQPRRHRRGNAGIRARRFQGGRRERRARLPRLQARAIA